MQPGSLPPLVVVFFGMTASGKSTLARAYAQSHGLSWYNTDRERKILAGLEPTDRCPEDVGQGIYSPGLSRQTYTTLVEKARLDLAAGQAAVVLDGSYGLRRDRQEVVDMAGQQGARVVFIYCRCGEVEVKRRLELRAAEQQAVSDGRWEIYQHQLAVFERPAAGEDGCHLTLDTDKELARVEAELEARLASLLADLSAG